MTAPGKPYELPGLAYNRLQGKPAAKRHRYIKLPPTLWTSGWIAVLSPAALAMLLVQLGTAETSKEIWIAPDYAAQALLLAEETRTRGRWHHHGPQSTARGE